MKKIAILTLALWSISNVFAFKPLFESQVRVGERSHIETLTQEWLQNNHTDYTDDTDDTSGGLRGGISGSGGPTSPTIPIGDGLFLLGLLTIGFVASKPKKAIRNFYSSF